MRFVVYCESSLFLSTPSARRATATRTSEIQLLFKFLSTPSARRATIALGDFIVAFVISIHALREEGDPHVIHEASFEWISIHALREEGDLLISVDLAVPMYFYPRPPRGGRLAQ